MDDRRAYDLARYHRLRQEYIAMMGGVCVDCNTTVSLQFDHVDPQTKEFDVGSNMFRPREHVIAELSKCVLRCRACHKKKSDNELSVPHGGGQSGKKNCKCEPCRKKKNEYMRDYKKRRRLEDKM